MKKMKWKLLGIDLHWRWREGKTWLDNAGGDHLLSHHGFYSLEWARGEHISYFRTDRLRRRSENQGKENCACLRGGFEPGSCVKCDNPAAVSPDSRKAEPVAWQHRTRPSSREIWSSWKDGKAKPTGWLVEERPLYAGLTRSCSSQQLSTPTGE